VTARLEAGSPLTATWEEDIAPRLARAQPSSGVESWFWRANHPTRPLAVWLKATVFVPQAGVPQAETWCVVFDAEEGRTWAEKRETPLAQATFGDGLDVEIEGARFQGGPSGGTLSGALKELSWDLSWEALPAPLGAPLCLLPTRRLIEARFPKNKLLTPTPALTLRGTLTCAGRELDVGGWQGSLGHNWGPAHPYEYAWGQVVFPDSSGGAAIVAEGYSGRLKLGPVRTPLLSGLVVRRGDQEHRFDRIVDRWNHSVELGDLSWQARFRGRAGDALISLRAEPELVRCLGYRNPDGTLSHCLNSKLASATLRVNPVNGDGFEVSTDHGAALELLSLRADPRFPPLGA
jgi:hypothetical protein